MPGALPAFRVRHQSFRLVRTAGGFLLEQHVYLRDEWRLVAPVPFPTRGEARAYARRIA